MSKIVIKIENRPIARGHNQHRSGAGKHADKRTKRNRTRQKQQHNSIKDE